MSLSIKLSTLPLLASFAVAQLATAQCPFLGVSSSSYGPACNRVFGVMPTVAVTLDTTNCRVDITVGAFSGCCNTFLSGAVLGIGLQPVSVPLPQIGPGCELLVDPVFLLFQPTAAGNVFPLALPAGLPPLTFFVQGGALYFTTIGLTTDLALTAGAQVTLS